MSTIFSQSDAAERIMAANLKSGSWGGSEAVCMMSALVSGAKSIDDCVTAGWPEWLVDLNVALFDADVGADNEDVARRRFAMDVALAVQTPRDMDKARDLFLIATLERTAAALSADADALSRGAAHAAAARADAAYAARADLVAALNAS